jgi:hypothetical protein
MNSENENLIQANMGQRGFEYILTCDIDIDIFRVTFGDLEIIYCSGGTH